MRFGDELKNIGGRDHNLCHFWIKAGLQVPQQVSNNNVKLEKTQEAHFAWLK